ncbi:hypothetical protein [Brevibacillus centrosporus]|uniref:hypothetical protein n=1 Tax=Brevibacillus centrosporus TaxID=54910 RepID=UPI003B014818
MRILFVSIVFCLSLLIGCSTTPPVEDAIRVATTAKKIQYDVMNPTEIRSTEQIIERIDALKPYYTEKALSSLAANREPTLPVDVAWRQKANLSVQNVSLSNQTEEGKEDTFTFHYIVEIQIRYLDGSASKEIQVNGQMDLIQEDGTWRISRDWNDGSLAKELQP